MGCPEKEIDLQEGTAGKRIIGIDLDDTLFWREVGIRYFGHLKNLLKKPSFPKQTLDEIPPYDHTPYDLTASNSEKISRVWHSRRTVIPGFAEMIREELEGGTEVYGITGRKASKAWYEMTDAQLLDANIKLTGIRMAPKSVSGLLSKADSIRELGITDYYDDDRRTIRYLAKLFPHVRFNYIDHGLAHLTEKDKSNLGNVTVIPIRDFAPPEQIKKGSAVRNSKLRELTDFVDPSLEAIYNKYNPKERIKAWHITLAGMAFSIAGIEVAEHQNRTGKRSFRRTALAVTLGLIGATLDLIDGKWARIARDKMTDDEKKERDELIGQTEDPAADGAIEAWQAGSAAYTAFKRGDRLGTALALTRLAITNLPRFTKALSGSFGFKVPETYSFRKIKFFGTSLGRKIFNYGASLRDTESGIPLQRIEDTFAVAAGGAVIADRTKPIFTPKGELELSDKEIEQAKFRAKALGLESLFFLGIAGYLAKRFLFKKH